MTTISFRTDQALKEQAVKIYKALGLNLTTALNMFLRQTVIQQKYPCSLELEIAQDAKSTYEPGFFALFGQGADLGFDEEPQDVPPEGVPL
ncbi:MAG: type II toxin-antitoxin system RelB/DinJ family antitoxin [Succinivibrio sp.]|jgi:addiction module RelB/DinJ family antitoxin|nr:type II toxin-antitoxin system RelB/DinJ family antitoxin [Succinivibrio sp.]